MVSKTVVFSRVKQFQPMNGKTVREFTNQALRVSRVCGEDDFDEFPYMVDAIGQNELAVAGRRADANPMERRLSYDQDGGFFYVVPKEEYPDDGE